MCVPVRLLCKYIFFVNFFSMGRIEISVSRELQGFFRVAGLKEAHADTADLDFVLEQVEIWNRAGHSSPFDLSELLRNCHITSRSQTPPEVAGNFNIVRMRREAEERRYQRSVKGTKRVTSFGPEIKEASSSVSFAFQFIISFIGAFLFGLYSTEIFLEWRRPSAALAGAGCAVGTLVLETVLLILRESKKAATC